MRSNPCRRENPFHEEGAVGVTFFPKIHRAGELLEPVSIGGHAYRAEQAFEEK